MQLARPDHLSSEQRRTLDRLFVSHLELWHAWRLLQKLHGIYLADDERAAVDALNDFSTCLAEFPVPEFDHVLKTLIKWAPEILAFHRSGRATNGRLEGLNNKLGVLKRIAYGFTNSSNFASRALLWCPGLVAS